MIFYHRIFRFLPPLIWTAIITILSLIPGDDFPQTGLANIPFIDKLIHVGMYLILAVLLVRPLKKAALPAGLFILIFTFLLGGVLELLQAYWAVNRSGSWLDLLADLAGAALGLVIWWYLPGSHKFTFRCMYERKTGGGAVSK
jgi:VanZ family protein